MKLALTGLLVAAACVTAEPAGAHHSYGMFDRQKELRLSGTVKEFHWTNPHSRLEVVVQSAAGAAETWDIEMGPPGQLVRSGWKRTILKAGDRISLTVSPLKDGKPGGHLITLQPTTGPELVDTVFYKAPAAKPQQ